MVDWFVWSIMFFGSFYCGNVVVGVYFVFGRDLFLKVGDCFCVGWFGIGDGFLVG